MHTVPITKFRANLSRILDEAERGVIHRVTRGGVPVARIEPFAEGDRPDLEAARRTGASRAWPFLGHQAAGDKAAVRELKPAELHAHAAEVLRAVESGTRVAVIRRRRPVVRITPEPQEAREAAVDGFIAERATWPRTGMTLEEILAARREGMT